MKKIESTIFLKNVIQFILKLGSWMLKIFTIYAYGRGGVGMVGNDINGGWGIKGAEYSPFSGMYRWVMSQFKIWLLSKLPFWRS